jgi:hypothetical protein
MRKLQNGVLHALLVTVNLVFTPCFGLFCDLKDFEYLFLIHLCSIGPAWFDFPPLFHSSVAENLMSGDAAVLTMPIFQIL